MTDQIKLPDKLEIQVTKTTDGRYELEYKETFNEVDRKAFETSIEIARAAYGHRDVVVSGNTITLGRVGTAEEIGDILAGEFLFWSTLGNATLRQLITAAMTWKKV